VPEAAALCGGAGQDDETDADELDGRRLLVQDKEPEDHSDGGFERHEGSERGRGQPAQGNQLEGERQHGEQHGQSGCGCDDADSEVAGRLWDAQESGGGGGDRDGQ
jgi:hypothetical protein